MPRRRRSCSPPVLRAPACWQASPACSTACAVCAPGRLSAPPSSRRVSAKRRSDLPPASPAGVGATLAVGPEPVEFEPVQLLGRGIVPPIRAPVVVPPVVAVVIIGTVPPPVGIVVL